MSKCKLFKAGAQRIKRMRPLQYLRELSVVIIGVAVTFYLTDVMAESREQKEIKLHLNAIYSELEFNLDIINSLDSFYTDHKILKQLLTRWAYSPKTVDMDSINRYSYVAFHGNTMTYKKGAYEMFINSGLMKAINNKELLLSITSAYMQLELVKEDHTAHMVLKNQEYGKLYSNVSFTKDDLNITDPKLINLFNFHALNDGIGSSIRSAKALIETALATKKERSKRI